jgi:hypothetical protein
MKRPRLKRNCHTCLIFLALGGIVLSGCGDADTPYDSITPPYKYRVVEEGPAKRYTFRLPRPPLEITVEGQISTRSANRILESIGLPPVSQPGLNVEKYWFGVARPRQGWPYRYSYRWDDYPSGPLTFEIMGGGCRWKGRTYDCLKQITVGPTDLDEKLPK